MCLNLNQHLCWNLLYAIQVCVPRKNPTHLPADDLIIIVQTLPQMLLRLTLNMDMTPPGGMPPLLLTAGRNRKAH